MRAQNGTLFIVSTPIGNLGDITLRALEVLKSVDVVLCEDTRHTKKLLAHYVIRARTESFHAHSIGNREDRILEGLKTGKRYALVSDAGTPLISDPGGTLVRRILRELGSAHIEIIPGPSALVSGIVRSGIACNQFIFLGFVPSKKGRETFFKTLAREKNTVVFYESKHKIMKTLESLLQVLPSDREIAVVREITKMHEETLLGSPQVIYDTLIQFPEKQNGEFVVVVSPEGKGSKERPA